MDLIISLLFKIYNNGKEIEQFNLLYVDFNLKKCPSVHFVLTKNEFVLKYQKMKTNGILNWKHSNGTAFDQMI